MEHKLNIELPVSYFVDKDTNSHVIVSNEETKKFINVPIVVQGDTKEEAIKEFWMLANLHIEFLEEQWHTLQKVAPFMKGPWKHKGGRWFSVFGIHIYFRYGKGMKYGWYIPFTKLNISITNYWRIKRKKDGKSL